MGMEVGSLDITDVMRIRTPTFDEYRGCFSEVYHERAFATAGIDHDFGQDSHSLAAGRGTVHGLHFQTSPLAQDKLVRVIRGAIFDVAIDRRRFSPTYRRHATVALSAGDWNQILMPVGFAHGLTTLEPDTEGVSSTARVGQVYGVAPRSCAAAFRETLDALLGLTDVLRMPEAAR